MNTWFKTSYRRNLVDMHIEDWNPTFMSEFNAENYAQMMKIANVKSVMIYMNSHVGYCNYPTESGYVHKQMRNGDKIGTLIDLCHKQDMDVILYYSLLFNNWAYEKYPEWRTLGKNGHPSRIGGGRFGTCCVNSQGYRKFVDQQIKEILSRYEGEGIFFDMATACGICYCDNCTARYRKETGREIPTDINWHDENWVVYQKKRKEWTVEFDIFTYETAKKYNSEITVEHNASPFRLIDWRLGCSIDGVQANDYIGGDIYGEPIEQSLTCKYFDAITPNKPFEYMTSRCDPELANHTTTKPKELLELNAFYSLAHSGAFLFIDGIDPKGTLNPKVYELMGEIFGKMKRCEPYVGGKTQKDVGLYLSMESDFEESDTDFSRISAFYSPGFKPHLDGLHSVTRAMKENNIPFWVLTKNNLDTLVEYQTIMLPDVNIMSDEEQRALLDFVKNGGSLYISGANLPELIKELTGAHVTGITKENVTYIVPSESGQSLFEGINLGSPLMVESLQVLIEGNTLNADEVLAKVALPYTDPKEKRFASIHSNPPGKETDYPAIIRKKYGNGEVIWSPAGLEKSKTEPNRKLFVRLIRSLAKKPYIFESNAPKPVEIIVFYQEDNKRYIINVLNAQQQMPPLRIDGIKIKLNSPAKAKAVKLLPDCLDIEFKQDKSGIEFTLPTLNIFAMIEVAVDKENSNE